MVKMPAPTKKLNIVIPPAKENNGKAPHSWAAEEETNKENSSARDHDEDADEDPRQGNAGRSGRPVRFGGVGLFH
jgi:hypothetical protein